MKEFSERRFKGKPYLVASVPIGRTNDPLTPLQVARDAVRGWSSSGDNAGMPEVEVELDTKNNAIMVCVLVPATGPNAVEHHLSGLLKEVVASLGLRQTA